MQPFLSDHLARRLRRRQVFKYGLLGVLSMTLPSLSCHQLATGRHSETSVIVVGAGVAGLAAAQKLQTSGFKVLVLEGRDRIGGRIWTDRSLGVPMDMGASWIHGPNGNPLTPLAKQAKAKTFVTQDESVVVYDNQGRPIPDANLVQAEQQYEKLLAEIGRMAEEQEQDFSVKEMIQQLKPSLLKDGLMQYLLTAYMEFDAGGPIEKLSARGWAMDSNFPGKDVILPDGYDAVINLIAQGITVRTGQIVQEINYDAPKIKVTTNQDTFTADCAVITLPLGVLKQGTVAFKPGLPESMTRAVQRVEMGMVNKVALLFPKAFWDPDLQYFGFTSEEKGQYPYFLNARTFSPANVLMTFGFGNYGLALESQSNQQIEADILTTLKTIFGSKVKAPQKILVSRWTADPFAQGSYSYTSVGSSPEDFQSMGAPIADRLFFAGEHTNPDYLGTVHGAYLSGIREADRIIEIYG